MPEFLRADETTELQDQDGKTQREAREMALQKRHSDMEVIFLGTASCVPSTTRGVSCTALKYAGKTWLIDAGEGTQVQIQKSPLVHPGKVEAIFVTHSHGDHTFGLPGLLCIIGQNKNDDDLPLHIYGPRGLGAYLRVSLQLTASRLAAKYIIHELLDVPFLPPPNFMRPRSWDPYSRLEKSMFQLKNVDLPADPNYGEVGSELIAPKKSRNPQNLNATEWEWSFQVPGSELTVKAAPMRHTVPCVGYVIQEPKKPGKLNPAIVAPILERNFNAMKQKGVRDPMKVYTVLKSMKSGQVFTFPDGTRLKKEDVVADDIPGRCLVFAGDTADASRLLPLLPSSVDLVVHEATNAHIRPLDNDIDPDQVQRMTAAHGHSTPEMAAEFAFRANASRLVMTHFSPRYKGDAASFSLKIMASIEKNARTHWAALRRRRRRRRQEEHHLVEDSLEDDDDDVLEDSDAVVAAWDLLAIPVLPGTSAAVVPKDDDDEAGTPVKKRSKTTSGPRRPLQALASSRDDDRLR